MCTLTLRIDDRSLLLTMNRDEKRSRAEEQDPSIDSPASGPSWAAPRDGASGGTWIGVNDRGLAACILNRYPAEGEKRPDKKTSRPSRGSIVIDALRRETLDSALEWARSELDRSAYSPFTLVLATVGEAVSLSSSPDESAPEFPLIRYSHGWSLLTSSSWNQENVIPWRHAQFQAWLAAGERFEAGMPSFQLLRPEGMEPWAPLMERPRTCTRSITQIFLRHGRKTAALNYWRMPFDGGAPSQTVELRCSLPARRTAAAEPQPAASADASDVYAVR